MAKQKKIRDADIIGPLPPDLGGTGIDPTGIGPGLLRWNGTSFEITPGMKITFGYNWSTTAGTPPADGDITVNAGNLYITDLGNSGLDNTEYIEQLRAGDFIEFGNPNDPSTLKRYQIGATPVLNAGTPDYYSMTATLIADAGTAITNRDAIGVKFDYSSSGGGGGSGSDIQIFTSNGTWTKPGTGSVTRVMLIGGGGGGGSGRRGASGTDRSGGGGGAPSATSEFTLQTASLGATEAVTVGAGGAGGAAVTVDDTNGNNGAYGGKSTFGNIVQQQLNGSPGGNGGATTLGAGVQPYVETALSHATNFGIPKGGNGTNTVGATSGAFQFHSSGAGAGGGGITSADAEGNGGVAAYMSSGRWYSPTFLNGGTAGVAPGGNGGAGNALSTWLYGTGGGGGAGGRAGGGDGGNGAGYGCGGGGGGASENGANSGKGGDGTDGIVIVISW